MRLSVLKPLWCFWKASSKSNSTCLFDLEVALRYTLFQRAPEISQRFVLSAYKKRDIKLIKNIGYVKLHGKHCQIRSNVKPFLRCVWLTRWLRQQGICLQCRRSDFDLWVRNIPWEGNGYLLQYSYLENSMDREAWWATVQGVAKSQTQLSNSHFQTCIGVYYKCFRNY